MLAAMITMQRRVNYKLDGDRERAFLSRSLRYMSGASRRRLKVYDYASGRWSKTYEDWAVARYEVDLRGKISSGGL